MRIRFGHILLSTLFGLAMLYSCATWRENRGIKECKKWISDRELQTILFEKDTIPFDFFYTRIGVDIKSEKINNWFATSVKMRIDSAFSGTVKVGPKIVGTYLITKDSVMYSNKIDKCYFREHLSYLSSIVGTEIEYDFFQNLLLGRPVGLDKSIDYKQVRSQQYYVLSSHKKRRFRRILDDGDLADPDDIYIEYLMECKNLELEKINVQIPADTVEMTIHYKSRKMESGQYVPNITHLYIKHPGDSVRIAINSGIVRIDQPKKVYINFSDQYDECP